MAQLLAANSVSDGMTAPMTGLDPNAMAGMAGGMPMMQPPMPHGMPPMPHGMPPHGMPPHGGPTSWP